MTTCDETEREPSRKFKDAMRIHEKFHHYLGYRIAEEEETLFALRLLVRKIERSAVRRYIKRGETYG